MGSVPAWLPRTAARSFLAAARAGVAVCLPKQLEQIAAVGHAHLS